MPVQSLIRFVTAANAPRTEKASRARRVSVTQADLYPAARFSARIRAVWLSMGDQESKTQFVPSLYPHSARISRNLGHTFLRVFQIGRANDSFLPFATDAGE